MEDFSAAVTDISSRHAWLSIYLLSHVLVSSHGAVLSETRWLSLSSHFKLGGGGLAITMEKAVACTQRCAEAWGL